MIRLLLVFSFFFYSFLANSEPIVEEIDGIEFEIGDSSSSGGSWCAWFPIFDWVGAEWSVNLPEGMTKKTPIWFCDRAKITAKDPVDFLKIFKTRYQGCLEIEINGRPDMKEINVKIGPQMVMGRRNESASYFLVSPSGQELEVGSDFYSGRTNYMCAYDIENAPDKEDGVYKIFAAARKSNE